MIKYNYITNEPDPLMKEDPNDNSGQFAFDASAGYNYNPQQVFAPVQQPMYQNMNQPVFSGAPMNTPVAPQQQGFSGRVGNPFFLPQGGMTQQTGMYNPWTQQAFYFQQQQQLPQDKVIHVDGYNPFGNKGLLPDGIESKCEQLQLDTMLAQEKVMAEREKRIQGYYVNNGYNYNYNYYGMPYMNTIDQTVYRNYVDQVRDIANAAMQSRIDFNKNISRLVHNFIGDGVSEDDINRVYEGYTYTIPGATVRNYEIQEKLEKCVPVDNSKYYQQQFDSVSQMYRSLVPETDNLNEYLANCGFLIMEDKLEEHLHRLKDSSRLYTPDTFHMYLRRYARENNIEQKQNQLKQEVRSGNLDNLPKDHMEATKLLLGESVAQEMADFRAKMETGFVPIGPQNQVGTPVVMTDELENEFEMRRGAFINSIYNNNNHAQENARKGVT